MDALLNDNTAIDQKPLSIITHSGILLNLQTPPQSSAVADRQHLLLITETATSVQIMWRQYTGNTTR